MEATAVAPTMMTKEAFHASKEYLSLTPRQRVWVDTFIDSQSAPLATKTAYGDKTDEGYRSMLTKKVETSVRVIAALDLFYGRSPREKFIRDLEMNIQNSEGIAKIEGQKLLAKVLGLISSDAEQPACSVGDVVLVDGVKHRVTAVDSNGRPTEGEPLL